MHRTRTAGVLAIAGLAILGPGVAEAQMLAERFTPPVCYARAYTAEHLAGHSRQRVRTISLRRTPDSLFHQDGQFVEIELSVLARGARESWGGVADCKDGAQEMRCWMEGDMGTLTIAPVSADTIELRVTADDGLSFETSKSFESIGKPGSDDRVFRLRRSPMKACED